MDDLLEFERLIIIALANVDESYYKTTYYNIQNFRIAFQFRSGRLRENNFDRFGERVFCYEFYHQLRLEIDRFRSNHPDFLHGAILQGEVEKMQIVELIEKFGLRPMAGEFAPDFLMHTPGNANLHPYVLEMKCTHDVSANGVLRDLRKLNEFVTKFDYQRGVFISVNTSIEHIEDILNRLSERISGLEGRERIKVICKTNQATETKIWQL